MTQASQPAVRYPPPLPFQQTLEHIFQQSTLPEATGQTALFTDKPHDLLVQCVVPGTQECT